MQPAIRVLVVDDESLLRTLIGSLLTERGYSVQLCANAAQAQSGLESFDPHVLITDLDLGEGPSGLDILREVARNSPWVARIVLTLHRSPYLVGDDHSGIDENTVFLNKNDLASADQLADAVDAALKGERFALDRSDDVVTLSRNQADVLRLAAHGLSNEQIATLRGTQVRAVEKLLRRVYEAMGITDDEATHARVAAAIKYRESGINVD